MPRLVPREYIMAMLRLAEFLHPQCQFRESFLIICKHTVFPKFNAMKIYYSSNVNHLSDVGSDNQGISVIRVVR